MATAPTTGDTAETAAETDPAPDTTEVADHTETRGDSGGRDGGSGDGDTGDGDTGTAAPRTLLRFPLGWGLGRGRTRALNLRPRRRLRPIDILRLLGLARRAVPRPVVGPKAYPQWWQRVLALAALVVLVAAIGFALAAFVGLMVVVAGFLLERAIA